MSGLRESHTHYLVVLGVALAMLFVPVQTAMATHNSFGVRGEFAIADEVDPDTGELVADVQPGDDTERLMNRYYEGFTDSNHLPIRDGPADQSGESYNPEDGCTPYSEFESPEDPGLTQIDAYENALPGYEHPGFTESTEDACYVGFFDAQAEYVMALFWARPGEDTCPDEAAGFTDIDTGEGVCKKSSDPLYRFNPCDGETQGCEEDNEDCDFGNVEHIQSDACKDPAHRAYWPGEFGWMTIDTDFLDAPFGGNDNDRACGGDFSCETPSVTDTFANENEGAHGSGTITLPFEYTEHIFLFGYPHPESSDIGDDEVEYKADDEIFSQPLSGVADNACGTDENQRIPPGECWLLRPEDIANYDNNWPHDDSDKGRLCNFDPDVGILNPGAAATAQPCGLLGVQSIQFETGPTGGFGTGVDTFQMTLPGYSGGIMTTTHIGHLAPLSETQYFETDNTTSHDDQDDIGNTAIYARGIWALNPKVPQLEHDQWCQQPQILTSGTQVRDAPRWTSFVQDKKAEIQESDEWNDVNTTFEVTVTSDPADDAEALSEDGITVDGLAAEVEPGSKDLTVTFQAIDDLVGANAWMNVTGPLDAPENTTQNAIAEEEITDTFELSATGVDLSTEGEYTVEVETDSTKEAAFFAQEFEGPGSFQDVGDITAKGFYGDYQAHAIDFDVYAHGLHEAFEAVHDGDAGIPMYDGWHEETGFVVNPVDEAIGNADDTVFGTANDALDDAGELIPEETPVDELLEDAQETANETEDEVLAASDRVGPTEGSEAEPLSGVGGYESFDKRVGTPGEFSLVCDGDGDEQLIEGESVTEGGLVYDSQVSRNTVSIKDPTILNGTLPAQESDTTDGTWQTDAYSFGVDPFVAFFDKGGDAGAFDGCDPQDGLPDPGLDECTWQALWDAHSGQRCSGEEDTCGQILQNRGFDVGTDEAGPEDEPHGVGVVSTLEISGPALVLKAADDVQATLDEAQLVNQDPAESTCVIMVSLGFADPLATHIGNDDTTFGTDEEEALCPGYDADHRIVHHGAYEGQDPGEGQAGGGGSISSTVSWIRLAPMADGVRETLGTQDDRLCVTSVFSTQSSVLGEGVSTTSGSLQLGADHTETYYRDCDVLTSEHTADPSGPDDGTPEDGTYHEASLIWG